jgi:hypothetical protein
MAKGGLRGESAYWYNCGLVHPSQIWSIKADIEAYLARVANEEIATTFKTLLPPIMRTLFSPTTTMTELIPYLMRIISPPLKPVSD